jgi:hypothetical protein
MNASTKQPCIPAFIAKLAVEFKSAMQTGFTLDDIGIVRRLRGWRKRPV